MILAFDPGVCTGWAVLSAGKLVSCGLLSFEAFAVTFPYPWAGFTTDRFPDLLVVEKLVVEKPQVYRSGLQKGSQADIVDTAFRAGILCAKARAFFGLSHFPRELFPTPHDWKGSTPKDIHNKRVLAKLSNEERALIPKLPKTKFHNCVDAIGLAWWAAGR